MSFESSCPKGLPRFPETEDGLEVKFEESTQAIEDCLLYWMCCGLLCPGDPPHVSICPTICSGHRRTIADWQWRVGGEKFHLLNQGDPGKLPEFLKAPCSPRQLQCVKTRPSCLELSCG